MTSKNIFRNSSMICRVTKSFWYTFLIPCKFFVQEFLQRLIFMDSRVEITKPEIRMPLWVLLRISHKIAISFPTSCLFWSPRENKPKIITKIFVVVCVQYTTRISCCYFVENHPTNSSSMLNTVFLFIKKSVRKLLQYLLYICFLVLQEVAPQNSSNNRFWVSEGLF